jgi:hypothetical protein
MASGNNLIKKFTYIIFHLNLTRLLKSIKLTGYHVSMIFIMPYIQKKVKPTCCLIEKVTQINADYPKVMSIGGHYGVMYLSRMNGQKVNPPMINQRSGYHGKKRIFTREFKKQAVKLALKTDRNLSEIAHQLGINGNMEAGGQAGRNRTAESLHR